ncbi:unnamed protein product, partial [Didymodactylos carnosus]
MKEHVILWCSRPLRSAGQSQSRSAGRFTGPKPRKIFCTGPGPRGLRKDPSLAGLSQS